MDKLINEIKNDNFNNFINNLKKNLQKGFNINCIDEYGNTLLHLVCRKRNLESFMFLINNGSNCMIKNKDGKLPIHITSIYSSETNIKNIFLNSKYKNNKLNDDCKKIINQLILNCPKSLLIKDNDGFLPLDYYNIHSNKEDLLKVNNVLKFFTLNNKNEINKDIVEKIDIYKMLKKNKQFK